MSKDKETASKQTESKNAQNAALAQLKRVFGDVVPADKVESGTRVFLSAEDLEKTPRVLIYDGYITRQVKGKDCGVLLVQDITEGLTQPIASELLETYQLANLRASGALESARAFVVQLLDTDETASGQRVNRYEVTLLKK